MKKAIRKMICSIGMPMCAFAILIAPMVTSICRIHYYQPEEPENLNEFIKI